jgi:hypothetical protein
MATAHSCNAAMHRGIRHPPPSRRRYSSPARRHCERRHHSRPRVLRRVELDPFRSRPTRSPGRCATRPSSSSRRSPGAPRTTSGRCRVRWRRFRMRRCARESRRCCRRRRRGRRRAGCAGRNACRMPSVLARDITSNRMCRPTRRPNGVRAGVVAPKPLRVAAGTAGPTAPACDQSPRRNDPPGAVMGPTGGAPLRTSARR